MLVVVWEASHGADVSSVAATPRTLLDGASMPTGLQAPDFSLRSEANDLVTLSRYRGKVVVLAFIDSRCGGECASVVNQLVPALDRTRSGHGGVQAIGISVAPSQDGRSERLRFLKRNGLRGKMLFVSGPVSTMRKVWRDYGVEPLIPGYGYSAFVALVDKRGLEVAGYAANQVRAAALEHDISLLERQSG